jgi:5-methyltetrahydrofolate--homocysteine methyltransferase
MDDLLRQLEESIYKGNALEAKQFSQKSLERGVAPTIILEKGMIPAMQRIGEDFSEGVAYIPDLLVSARAMRAGMEILQPAFLKEGVKPKGKIVLGTVFGDVHNIGKDLAKMCFEGAGFQVIDLGIDVSTDRFIEADQEHQPDLIGLSALLTTTLIHMQEIIKAVRLRNPRAKFIVGGAPVTEEFSQKIEADAYAEDAFMGVRKAKNLLGLE